MEVKRRSKQTEIGNFPEDWDVQPLGVCLLGKPEYGIGASAIEYDENYPTYIRITDITEDGRYSSEKKASVDCMGDERYILHEGDFLFARTGASVGKSYLYDPKDGLLAFAGFLIRVRPDPSKLLPEFLAGYTRTKQYWNWIQLMSMRSGQPGINGNEYSQLPVPLPSSIEQRLIAAALRDVDALLAALDELIAKKRLIKQGALQELLTGKKRLPGFREDWTEIKLGEMGKCYRGVSYNPNTDLSAFDTTSTVRLLRANNVQDASIIITDMQYVNSERVSSDQYMRRNDILVCMANGSRNLVGKAGQFTADDDFEYTFGAFMGCFRPNDQAIDPNFSFYLFQTEQYRNHIDILLAGSSINNLTPSNLEAFIIRVPINKKEQTAIAEILSDIDAEISALEARREKTRLIKQGMMQELLTGRIRLI